MFTSMPNPDLYSPLARIIDDEETVRNSEAFMLRMGGINAVAYESAEEFLARDDLRHPGCLVLDVRMPGMSGLDVHDPCLPAYLPRSDLLYDPEVPFLHKAALFYSESVPVMFSDIRP